VRAGVILLGLALAQRAAAAPPAAGGGAGPLGPFLGSSACPQPEAVAAELATLVQADRGPGAVRAAGPIEIVDLGASFRVGAAGRAREYRDEARDCAHRARVAAVFVALAIAPASLAEPPAPPPPQPPPPPAPRPAPPQAPSAPPAPADRIRIDVGAAVDVGVGANNLVAHPGVAFRVAAGQGRLAFVAGASALVPVDTTIGGVRLSAWRLPVDAGVRARLTPAALAPYADLGLGATLVSARGVDLATTDSDTGVELGLRAAVGARLATPARLTAFATIAAEWVPRPAAIFALPRGEAGHTPAVWLGATVGGSVGLW
jgi:hypothetical protein